MQWSGNFCFPNFHALLTKDNQVALAVGFPKLILHYQGVLPTVLSHANGDSESADPIRATTPVTRIV